MVSGGTDFFKGDFLFGKGQRFRRIEQQFDYFFATVRATTFQTGGHFWRSRDSTGKSPEECFRQSWREADSSRYPCEADNRLFRYGRLSQSTRAKDNG